MKATLNRVVFPQGFMLLRFKMYLVKLKGDEEIQEEHRKVIGKNIPSGKNRSPYGKEELEMDRP